MTLRIARTGAGASRAIVDGPDMETNTEDGRSRCIAMEKHTVDETDMEANTEDGRPRCIATEKYTVDETDMETNTEDSRCFFYGGLPRSFLSSPISSPPSHP